MGYAQNRVGNLPPPAPTIFWCVLRRWSLIPLTEVFAVRGMLWRQSLLRRILWRLVLFCTELGFVELFSSSIVLQSCRSFAPAPFQYPSSTFLYNSWRMSFASTQQGKLHFYDLSFLLCQAVRCRSTPSVRSLKVRPEYAFCKMSHNPDRLGNSHQGRFGRNAHIAPRVISSPAAC